MGRSTLLLVIVALGLAGYIFFFDAKQKSTDEQEQITQRLFDYDGSLQSIDRLQITSNQQTILIRKMGGRWAIQKPIVAPADTVAVEKILSELESGTPRRIIRYSEIQKPDATLKEWGLASPSISIEWGADKQHFELQIGRKTALSDIFYARTSSAKDAPVVLISSSLRDALDKKMDDLRSRVVLSFNPGEVTTVTVRATKDENSPTTETEVIRKQDEWMMQKPLEARADVGKVKHWLAGAAALRAIQFVSEDNSNLNAYGLTAPRIQFCIVSESGENSKKEEKIMLIGSAVPDKAEEVYAKCLQSNTVFTLRASYVQQMLQLSAEWRSRKVLAFEPAEVSGFTVDLIKGKSISFKKNDASAWTFADKSAEKANGELILSLLGKLAALDATAFVKDTATELKSYGLDKPQRHLVLHFAKGKSRDSLELILGKNDKQGVYAKNSADPFIFSIAANSFDDWPKERWQWKALRVLEIDRNKIQKVTFYGRAGVPVTVTCEADGQFQTDVPDRAVDGSKMEMLLSLLCHLRAERWLGSMLPAYALKDPLIRVVINADHEYVLKIGAEIPSLGRAAQIDNQSDIFEISPADFSLLDKSPLVAKLPEFKPDKPEPQP